MTELYKNVDINKEIHQAGCEMINTGNKGWSFCLIQTIKNFLKKSPEWKLEKIR